MFNLQCIKCDTIFPFAIDLATCPYHDQKYGYLEVIYNTCNGATRLPFKNTNMVFQIAKTPLIKSNGFASRMGVKNLYIKDESKNPTGSFKDR